MGLGEPGLDHVTLVEALRLRLIDAGEKNEMVAKKQIQTAFLTNSMNLPVKHQCYSHNAITEHSLGILHLISCCCQKVPHL